MGNMLYSRTVPFQQEVPSSLLGLEELDRIVLLQSQIRDLYSLCRINTFFAKICQDDFFWRDKIRLDFPTYPIEEIPIGDYKSAYRCLFKFPSDTELIHLRRTEDLIARIKSGHDTQVTALNLAAKLGFLDVIQVAAEKTCGIKRYPDQYVIDRLVGSGDLRLAELLIQYECRPTQMAADIAAAQGKLDVLKWLSGREIHPTRLGFEAAKKKEHSEIVSWIQNH